MAEQTDRERIEQACQQHGLTIKGWDEHEENGLTANLGPYIVVTPDDDHGLYDGDTGELTACVVGAVKYGNQRVSYSFIPEGCDGGSDVPDLTALEALDA